MKKDRIDSIKEARLARAECYFGTRFNSKMIQVGETDDDDDDDSAWFCRTEETDHIGTHHQYSYDEYNPLRHTKGEASKDL